MKRNININLAVIFISVCIICVMLATHCAKAEPVLTTDLSAESQEHRTGIVWKLGENPLIMPFDSKKQLTLPPQTYMTVGDAFRPSMTVQGFKQNEQGGHMRPDKPEEITVELITQDGTTYTAQWMEKGTPAPLPTGANVAHRVFPCYTTRFVCLPEPTVQWFNETVRAKNRALIELDKAQLKAAPNRAFIVRYVPAENDGVLLVYPQEHKPLEFGFRSDGVVVWREAMEAK